MARLCSECWTEYADESEQEHCTEGQLECGGVILPKKTRQAQDQRANIHAKEKTIEKNKL